MDRCGRFAANDSSAAQAPSQRADTRRGAVRFAGVDDHTMNHYRTHAPRDASDHLHALVDSPSLQPHECTLCRTEGDAAMHLLSSANERGCDLIVIGKHGRQASDELLLGSVPRHVVTEADCDVLLSTHRD
jgi:nucleotide-binding universal stress UspA family protein